MRKLTDKDIYVGT